MRIRTIKPEFFTDRKVRSLDPFDRLLFIGLWLMADDEGKLEEDPPLIKGQLFPSDEVDVGAALDRLVQLDMLRRYKVNGLTYLHVRNFNSHQVISKPRRSKLPPAPKETEQSQTAVRDESGTSPGTVREESGTRSGTVREESGTRSGTVREESGTRPGTVRDVSIRKGIDKIDKNKRTKKSIYQSIKEQKEQPVADLSPNGREPPGDGQTDSSLFQVLEVFFPKTSIEKLTHEYPPERLLWAAQRVRAAAEVRKIRKPASYFLHIVKSDEQWERYICDQYALGKLEAQKRQQEIAKMRKTRKRAQERRERVEAEDAFQKYLNTVPAHVRETTGNYVLREWVRSNNVNLEHLKDYPNIMRRTVGALYREHVWRAWQGHGKPEKYEENHLENLESGKETQK